MERYYFCSTNQSAFVLDLNRSPEKQNDTGHEFTLSCGYWGEKGASDGMITDAKELFMLEIMKTTVSVRYCQMA